MNSIDDIRLFLDPKSVAVIGANPNTGELAFNLVENLARWGYEGQVYPVNPAHSEVLGWKCYAEVGDIPAGVDLAVLVTPRTTIPDVIRQCGEKGVRAAVVVGQGFADAADEEGRRLQDELVEAGRRSGVRVLGPNTMGSLNPFADFSTSFLGLFDVQRRPIGVVSQSGLFFTNVGRMRLLGKAIDVGNACDVDITEALDYFAQDPEVKVVVLHIEGVRDGRRFMEVARRATRRKPVLALKTGRSEPSARAAVSHTGSLVGNDDVWNALFKQCGVVRADNLDELGDLAKAFLRLPLMKGRRVAAVSGSGGAGIMSIDACVEHGLQVADLSPATRSRLQEMSPRWHRVGNPLDLWPLVMGSPADVTKSLRTALSLLLSDRQVDGVAFFGSAWFDGLSPSLAEVIADTADAFPDKPIALSLCEGVIYDIGAEEVARKLDEAGKACVFSNPDDALRALSRLAAYAEFLRGA